jgi:hypothetical protein
MSDQEPRNKDIEDAKTRAEKAWERADAAIEAADELGEDFPAPQPGNGEQPSGADRDEE